MKTKAVDPASGASGASATAATSVTSVTSATLAGWSIPSPFVTCSDAYRAAVWESADDIGVLWRLWRISGTSNGVNRRVLAGCVADVARLVTPTTYDFPDLTDHVGRCAPEMLYAFGEVQTLSEWFRRCVAEAVDTLYRRAGVGAGGIRRFDTTARPASSKAPDRSWLPEWVTPDGLFSSLSNGRVGEGDPARDPARDAARGSDVGRSGRRSWPPGRPSYRPTSLPHSYMQACRVADRVRYRMREIGDVLTVPERNGFDGPDCFLPMYRSDYRCGLIRSILGNPFVPAWAAGLTNADGGKRDGFDPAFDNPEVVAVARVIVAEGRYDESAILADALEDAGCNDVRAIRHLRGVYPLLDACVDATPDDAAAYERLPTRVRKPAVYAGDHVVEAVIARSIRRGGVAVKPGVTRVS